MKNLETDITSNSYTPYSKHNENCFVLGESGTLYEGVQIENASYPLTIPAVQAAVCSCLASKDHPSALIRQDSTVEDIDFWSRTFRLDLLDEHPTTFSRYDPLVKDIDDQFSYLEKLAGRSVSHQSGFPVAALLITTQGMIPGVNIEFNEWNLGLCAERVAISRAIAAGYKDFLGIHVYAPKSDYISPCGACRQVLFELMPNQKVILHHDQNSTSRHIVSHLLPNGFTSNSLNK